MMMNPLLDIDCDFSLVIQQDLEINHPSSLYFPSIHTMILTSASQTKSTQSMAETRIGTLTSKENPISQNLIGSALIVVALTIQLKHVLSNMVIHQVLRT